MPWYLLLPILMFIVGFAGLRFKSAYRRAPPLTRVFNGHRTPRSWPRESVKSTSTTVEGVNWCDQPIDV